MTRRGQILTLSEVSALSGTGHEAEDSSAGADVIGSTCRWPRCSRRRVEHSPWCSDHLDYIQACAFAVTPE